MNRQQFALGAILGMFLSSATLAIALGYTALFGIQIAALGVRLTPDDFPTDLRAAFVLAGILGLTAWLSSALILGWLIVRRRSVAQKVSPPPWYTGAPSIPYFTPPIPPPEAAYFNLSQAFRQNETPPQRSSGTHLERTQVPAMPPLLSYESLFPTEQTAQVVPPPTPEDDAPDAAPTVPPPEGSH
jgi:hypothetical protein